MAETYHYIAAAVQVRQAHLLAPWAPAEATSGVYLRGKHHHTEGCLCSSSPLQTPDSPASIGLRVAAMAGAGLALLVAASSLEAAWGGRRAEETSEAAPVAPAACMPAGAVGSWRHEALKTSSRPHLAIHNAAQPDGLHSKGDCCPYHQKLPK